MVSEPASPPNQPSRTEANHSWLRSLRPLAGRRLPARLSAKHVHRLVDPLVEGVADPAFATLLGQIDGRAPYGGNEVEVFFRGEEAFAAMRRAIEAARDEVLLESYIFTDDATGRGVVAALVEARQRGVVVRVVVDAVGSAATREEFWREMGRAGIEVRRFHPLRPDFLRHPFRDHRKILVVDREVAFTGGMNIADEYGSARPRHGEPWRDSHVQAKGPVAHELALVFAESWHLSRSFRRGSRLVLSPFVEPHGAAGTRVMVLDSRPNRGHAESAAVFAALVAGARRSLFITNAYFAPKRIAAQVLGRAAARGVDVRLLLPGRTDVPLVRHAGHGFFTGLLEQGVRIFEYQRSVLHAKCLVADGLVSMVGSTNLDFRSFTFNGECNLVVFEPELGGRMEQAFLADVADAEEVELRTWRHRPLPHRLGDALARGLAPLL